MDNMFLWRWTSCTSPAAFLSTICSRWSNTHNPGKASCWPTFFESLAYFWKSSLACGGRPISTVEITIEISPQKNLTWSQATRNSHKGQAETRGGQSQTCTSVFVCVCVCVRGKFKVLVNPIAKVYRSTSGSSANIPVFFWKYVFFACETIQRFPWYCMRLYFWKYSCGLAKV